MKKKHKKNNLIFKKGFSLIEVLIVIALMAVVSSIGIFSFGGANKGAQFRASKSTVVEYIERIRFKAYSDGKHYKVFINNSGANLTLSTYEPDSNNIKWRDINLNRRCNCYSGTGAGTAECNQAFSNVSVSSLTAIASLNKTVEQLNVKVCNNADCDTETNVPSGGIEFCFLSDGTSTEREFFKISGNDLSTILTLNNTGYVQ
jgi:prepilin-type N-terminal cleavage/methylation domain-containing protein